MILVPLALLLLFVGCNLFSTPDKGKGQEFYYTADSTGTERYSFHVGEPVFVHYKIVNPTNHDIPYKKIPYMDDNTLFSYGLHTPEHEEDGYIETGYPPQDLQETYLPKHESREQVYKIEGLEAHEYGVRLNLTIFFMHPNDFEGDYNPDLHFVVEGGK